MPNRIDVNFDQKGYDNLTDLANQSVTVVSGYFREYKTGERTGGQNMGEGTGYTFAKKLIAIKGIFGNWIGNMEGAFIMVGKDLMEQANSVLTALKPLSVVSSAYKILYDDLNFLYENRATKAAATIETQKRIADLEKQLEEAQKLAKPS